LIAFRQHDVQLTADPALVTKIQGHLQPQPETRTAVSEISALVVVVTQMGSIMDGGVCNTLTNDDYVGALNTGTAAIDRCRSDCRPP